jgi:uncharacterized membrane protein HdeD (DUF308 family)
VSDLEYLRKRKRPPASLVVAILGLTCLCIGSVLHLSGKASSDLTVARIGAYVLVVGIMLIMMRLLFWIAAEIVKRGYESSSANIYERLQR